MARKSKPKARQAQPAPGLLPRLLNRRAAAAYISVSTAYVDMLRVQGLLKPVPLPAAHGAGQLRIPLFDRADLDFLIDKLKAGGAS